MLLIEAYNFIICFYKVLNNLVSWWCTLLTEVMRSVKTASDVINVWQSNIEHMFTSL